MIKYVVVNGSDDSDLAEIDGRYFESKNTANEFAKEIFEELGRKDNIYVVAIEDGYRIENVNGLYDSDDYAVKEKCK